MQDNAQQVETIHFMMDTDIKPNNDNTVNTNDSINCGDKDSSYKLRSCDTITNVEMNYQVLTQEEKCFKVKRFICQVCFLDGKEFSCKQRSSLEEHMQIHRAVKHLTYSIQTDNVIIDSVTSQERIVSRNEDQRIYCMICKEDLSNEADSKRHACKSVVNCGEFLNYNRNYGFRPYCSGICVCPICKMYFSKFEKLDRHIKSCHLQHSEGKLVASESNKDSQTKSIRTIMTVVCLLCDGVPAYNRTELNYHFGRHIGAKLYKYKLCYKATEMDANNVKERVLLEFDQIQFFCKDCKRDFLSEEEFIAHEIRHKVLINCSLCGDQISEADFIEHVEMMHNLERYCNICRKKFVNYHQFIEHLLSKHTSGQMYNCSLCKEHFPHFTQFQKHMKFRHSGHSENTVPYAQVCYACGKKYTDHRALVQHIHTHDADLPKCDHCQKTFTQMGSLRSHIAIHFGGTAHTCILCQKSFRTAIYLKNHTKQVHTRERPFICDKCGYRARNMEKLRFHTKVHSKMKQFQCKNCEVRFRWPNNLQIHMKKGVCTNI